MSRDANCRLPAQAGTLVVALSTLLLASATTAGREHDGYLVGARGGNMYCHGMATLALSQLWGMTGDEEVKPVLKAAIKLVIDPHSPNP